MCVIALLGAGALLGPGCSSTTIIEENTPPVDAGAKFVEGGGFLVGLGDPTAMDAAVGPTNSAAPDARSDTEAGFVIVPSDAGSCPDADLRCHVDTCAGSGTSISGTVYDPAGKNPIPHVFVFVPATANASLPAISAGTNSCQTCNLPIGSYVTATMTDATGQFTLTGVPTGAVPVVLQIGKWRRQITVNTTSCQNTNVTVGAARLPRNRKEGDMPEIGLLTGGLDDLGCFLIRMGVDPAEYGAPHSGGRVDVYQGLTVGGGGGPALSNGVAGNCTNTSCPLWASKQSLEKYDLVVLGCEGNTFDETIDAGGLGGGGPNITAQAKQAMHDWLDEGGKVFATHFHFTWFMNGPSDFQGVATWKGYSLGNGSDTATIQTSFPKGQDFENALVEAGASSNGNLNLTGISDSVGPVKAPTRAWLIGNSSLDPKYLTFTTPVGGTCGKAGFADLHAGGAPSGDVPGSCTVRDLSAQEKALELVFFDLSACVSDDSMAAPGPPPSN
jgi:hypothetical protein